MKNQFIDEIKQIEKIANSLHQEDLSNQASTNYEKTKLNDELNDLNRRHKDSLSAIHRINENFQQTKYKYQREIADKQKSVSFITTMENDLPHNLYEKFCPKRVTIPQRIDLEHIAFLYERITDNSASAAFKKLFHTGGFYNFNEMVSDFFTLCEEAKLYISMQIDVIEKKMNSEQQENTEKINSLTINESEKHKEELSKHKKKVDEEKLSYEAREADLTRKKKEFLTSNLVLNFSDRLNTYLQKEDRWDSYSAVQVKNNLIKIGYTPIKINADFKSFKCDLENRIPELARGFLYSPMTVNLSDSLKLLVKYTDANERKASEQIQLVLLKMLKNAPIDTYDIYFVDPEDRGSNIGILNASAEENEKISIYTCNAKDEIKSLFKQLEKEIDDVGRLIGSYNSVYEYNKAKNNSIKEKVLVLFDFPKSISAEEISTFGVLVNNAKRCGLHLIVSTELAEFTGIRNEYKNASNSIDWSFADEDQWNVVSISKNKTTIKIKDSIYDYTPEALETHHRLFVELYRKTYEQGLIIDNTFSHLFNVDDVTSYKDGTDGLHLPVMVRTGRNGGVRNLDIGTSTSTHTLITGSTSSGKSTFLHMIISSIIMNYHPDDVELWLVDYGKVEFNEYYQHTPPHVRFISLEKSVEFTYSFLDYLHDFFSKREKLFEAEGVTNIQGFRKKHGKLSMPRVVLIVDEFHNMTQHVQQNVEYRLILENALAEYRKFGLSCIFSNQTVSGLQGLTDTAKLQIKNRIALSNEISEMKETLKVGNDNYTDDMLHKMERTSVGELWYKEWTSVSDFSINQFKGIYINDNERAQVLKNVCNNGINVTNDPDVKRINSSERQLLPLKEIQANAKASADSRKFCLCLGSPITVEKTFSFAVEHRYNHNLLLVGRNIDLKRDIVVNILLNAYAMGDFDVFVYADERNELFEELQDTDHLRSESCNVKVFTDISELCFSINSIVNVITSKKPQRKTLILWLGLPDLFDEFNVSPRKDLVKFDNIQEERDIITIDNVYACEKDEALLKDVNELGISVKDMLQNLSDTLQQKKNKEEDYSYNACEDVLKIITNGGKFNIHSIIPLDGGYDFKKTKILNTEHFVHKIVLNIPREDLFELGIRSQGIELEEGKAAMYTDGSKFKKFRPYLTE